MMAPFSHLELGSAAALVLAAALAAGCAGAPGPSSGDASAVPAARKRAPGFEIRGNLGRPLAPAVSQPLNLRLTNRQRFGLRILRLTIAVSVDARHAAAGCRASANFTVTPLARRAYPIRLGPRRTRTLRALGVKRLPRVTMRNLLTSQDACKGARLKLRYTGRAQRWQGRQAP